AIALDSALAREPHFVFMADDGELSCGSSRQSEFLQQALGTEVFPAFFDEHFARPAQAKSMAVQRPMNSLIDLHAGLHGFLAQVRSSGNLNVLLFRDERYLGHEFYPLSANQRLVHSPLEAEVGANSTDTSGTGPCPLPNRLEHFLN